MTPADQFRHDFSVLNQADGSQGPPALLWQTRLFEEFYANTIPHTLDLPTGLGKTSVIHIWLLALRYQLLEKKKPRLPLRLIYVVDRRTVVDQATAIAERARKNLQQLDQSQLPPEWLSVSTLRGEFADNRGWTTNPARPAIVIGTVDMIGSRLLFSGYRSSFKARPLDAGMLGQDSLLVLDEAHLSLPFDKLIRAISDKGPFQSGQGSPLRVMTMSATPSPNSPDAFRLEPSDLEEPKDANPVLQRYDAVKKLIITPLTEKARIADVLAAAALQTATASGSRVVVFTRRPDDAMKIRNAIGKKLSAEVLTGTMRGYERDALLETSVLKRFLDGNERPGSGKGPCILVSTSAGEVGFDLNADHMVCDSTPLDSMIQRLGRVNRRGYGEAEVKVFYSEPKDNKREWENAAFAAVDCLARLPEPPGSTFRDASPRALDGLRTHLTAEEGRAASTPRPTTKELTDILLDAWSLTTIYQRMPGRPEVGPWLRGISEEPPQTTIAWRRELDLDGFSDLDLEDIEEWFDAHPILPHETLSVPSSAARDWLIERAAALSESALERTCITDRAGLSSKPIEQLLSEIAKRDDAIQNADLILPASFGGIAGGLLDAAAQIADEAGTKPTADVADERGRRRFLLEDGQRKPLSGELPADFGPYALFELDLPATDDKSRQLVSLVPRKQRPEAGFKGQSLATHVGLVEKYAQQIADQLCLDADSTVSKALKLAAKWHDNGKDRDQWQLAARRRDDDPPLGKSRGSMRRIKGGYRHEFGSIRELADFNAACGEEVLDLALHLIATHHGRSRPHFPKGGFDPKGRGKSESLAADALRRFARLQRRYGYWYLAWLENLLRCADAMASADKDAKS